MTTAFGAVDCNLILSYKLTCFCISPRAKSGHGFRFVLCLESRQIKTGEVYALVHKYLHAVNVDAAN